jgi:hypothetical protein
MNIILKAADEILGYADTAQSRTDPPMGCGEVVFIPNSAYSLVEALYRERSLSAGVLGKRDETKLKSLGDQLKAFNLTLATEAGEELALAGFTIIDYREELTEEDIFLEFYGLSYDQFNQLFPGQYESYKPLPEDVELDELDEIDGLGELEAPKN